MTCNPNWLEKNEVQQGYTKYNQPDLLYRFLEENIKILSKY